jgi:hypothetical protein
LKTEADMRAELAASQEALQAAAEALSRATSAFDNAELRRGKAEQHLASLIDVDAALTAHALAAARCGAVDDVMPEDLRERLAARSAADAAHRACCDASTILRRSLAEASSAHGAAVTRTEQLALAVISVAVADKWADEIHDLQNRIEQLRRGLLVWDRVATPLRAPMSHRVRAVLADANPVPLGPDDLAAFSALVDALRADSRAELSIELPVLPPPLRPVPLSYGGPIEVMEPLTKEELAARGLVPALDDGDPHLQEAS